MRAQPAPFQKPEGEIVFDRDVGCQQLVLLGGTGGKRKWEFHEKHGLHVSVKMAKTLKIIQFPHCGIPLWAYFGIHEDDY